MLLFVCLCDCRCDSVCGLSGPQLFASDDRKTGAGGRVAVPSARRVPDGQLQRGPSALLPHRTPHLTGWIKLSAPSRNVDSVANRYIQTQTHIVTKDTCRRMEEILMLLLNCEDWPLMVLKDSLAHMGAQQKMIVNWAPFWDPDYVPHGRRFHLRVFFLSWGKQKRLCYYCFLFLS